MSSSTTAPDPDSSSSTLPAPPASPFSASLDPNAPAPSGLPTPLALRKPSPGAGPGGGASAVGESPAGASALWSARLSASFGAIADQLALAARELASAPPPPAPARAGGAGALGGVDVAALEALWRAQDAMRAELRGVQERLARLAVDGPQAQRADVVEEVPAVGEGEGGEPERVRSPTEVALEELQKKVDGLAETIRLDQARLYARLHNAAVTANKQPIKAPVMAGGKTPQNFPGTKGEFEHLTKERYEALLQGYGLPVKGDTGAKREALREFIGLTPAV
ncbi:hypothetical protein BD413DRAFT_604900 [Trametes elegans]|nr:hypothetical protein BD413DRAFT_604900 [Trametes elegans]